MMSKLTGAWSVSVTDGYLINGVLGAQHVWWSLTPIQREAIRNSRDGQVLAHGTTSKSLVRHGLAESRPSPNRTDGLAETHLTEAGQLVHRYMPR